MRGSKLRVEARLDGTIAMRLDNHSLAVAACEPPQRTAQPQPAMKTRNTSRPKSRWMEGFFQKPSLPLGRAIAIANASSRTEAKAESGAPGKHRPAVFAFTCPKPPLGSLHQNDLRKAKNPYSSQAARVSTDHSGASPVASALGIRLGAPPGGRNYTNTHSENHASKGTFLPCWKRGHFHFALTLCR